MTTRRSYFAKVLAVLVAAACGANRLAPAQAQSNEAQSNEAQSNEAQSNEAQSGAHDVVSRDSVWRDPDIPAQGNPYGDVTLMEYFDYQCPVCKRVHPDLARAVRDDGKVRLVSKGWPIFGGVSVHAARIALAAKYQGKFAQAHETLFTAKVPLTEAVIADLLSKAGVDPARTASDLAANRSAIDAVLARNQAQAEAFGFPGTPAFIVGTFRVNGGLDAAGFKQVIAAARSAPEQR
jgi:protein-disulfide isomerase